MSIPSLRVGLATPATLGRRACAALALSSAGLHAAMLGHSSNVVAGVLLAAMVIGIRIEKWRLARARFWNMPSQATR